MGKSLKIKLDKSKEENNGFGHFIFAKMREKHMPVEELVAKIQTSGVADMGKRKVYRILEDDANVSLDELLLIISLVGFTEKEIKDYMRMRAYEIGLIRATADTSSVQI